MKRKTGLLVLASIALSLSVGAFISHKQAQEENLVTFATYTNGDAATYYNSIDDSQSGNTLLTALRNLNLNKRKDTVGYSSMGTTPSGQFKYTDYDTNYVQYDSNGQPYGTRISSFYTYTSATSWNREHVWPNSHGGGSGGSAGTPYPDADIHMPRPTISSENSSRGNSFFVEGMNSSSAGWDPYTAGYSAESRGEAARITFYCMLVNSKLSLAPNNTSPSGTDPITGNKYSSGTTMGNLETLLKWNINYPVNQREKNRNEGAEYLQGNRNAFVDHPEYACKIWGNVNSTTQSLCSNASWDTGAGVTISASNIKLVVDGTATLTATASDGSTITWSTSDDTVAEVNNGVVTGVGPGTATITATATIDGEPYTATCAVTVSSSSGGGEGGDTPEPSGSITLNGSTTGLSSSDTQSNLVQNGVNFVAKAKQYNSTVLWLSGGSGYIYNTTNLGKIKKVTINYNSGGSTSATQNLSFGTSAITGYKTTHENGTQFTNSSSSSPNSFSPTGDYGYFNLSISGSKNLQASSIVIEYDNEGGEEEDLTLSSIALSNKTTSYTVGDTFVAPTVTATFSDNSTEDVTENTEFTGYNMSKAGNYTVTASFEYGGVTKTATYDITVAAAKTLSSISVKTAPTKITYTEGEYFDPTGLVITRTYSDNSTDTYTYAGHISEFTFSPSTSTALSTSNNSVTITYSDKSTTQAITVNAAPVTLSSISIQTAPTTTSYEVGDNFDPTGLVITRNYSNNTSDTYTYAGHESEFSFDPDLDEDLAVSDTSVTITYGGKSTTQAITVSSSGGGEEIGGEVDADYPYDKIGSTWTLTDYSSPSGYALCPNDGNESIAVIPGIFTNKTITSNVVITINCATYGSGGNPTSSTFSTYNSAACSTYVSSTQSGTLPSSSTYTDVIYTVSQANAVAGFSDDLAIKITKPGKKMRIKSINVSFTYTTSGGTEDPTLSSISVDTAPTKLSYTVGEYFNPTGLVITRHYSNSTSDTYAYAGHTSEFTFSPSLSTALALDNTSITITYGGKSTTQAITVTSSGGGEQEESDYSITTGSPYINGVAYKMYFSKSSTNYYFNGELVNNYYGETTTTKSSGVDVYFEENGNGQNIYMIKNSTKKYFYTASSSNHVNFKFDVTAAPGQVWTYNSTKETMVYGSDGVGADSSHNTICGEKITYYAKFETKDSTGAVAFATVMNDSVTCNASGTSAPSLSYSWSFFESVYANLDSASKAELKSANPSDSEVVDFVARYDYIVGKYGYTDFLDRSPSPISNDRSDLLSNMIDENYMLIVVGIIASISLCACALLIIKKRKNR